MVQVNRNVPEHLCTHIDPPGLEINEREGVQIIVMVVTMNNPSVKSSGHIIRIVDETETESSMFQKDPFLCPRLPVVMISRKKSDSAP